MRSAFTALVLFLYASTSLSAETPRVVADLPLGPVALTIRDASAYMTSETGATVDIAIVATKERCEAATIAELQALDELAIAALNQALIDSAIPHRANYLGPTICLNDYSEIGRDHRAHLRYMRENLDDVRAATHADVLVMMVQDVSEGGRATIRATNNRNANAVLGRIDGYFSLAPGLWLFIHEVGHVFGARHRRASIAVPPDDPYFAWSWRASPSRTYTTVMAKSCVMDDCSDNVHLAQFSNPAVFLDGLPTGTPDDNNAAILIQHMPVAATFNAPAPAPDCTPGDRRACLQDRRYAVEVTWETPDNQTGDGRLVPGVSSPDSGLFYFFRPANWELMVKVLDACTVNQHFWVFAAATTNVAYTLTVTDTITGETREYQNPQGIASAAVTDTQAFATCP